MVKPKATVLRLADVFPAMPEAPIDPVRTRLPSRFRITSIDRLPGPAGQIQHRARLYHRKAGLAVQWLAPKTDPQLVAGALVSIRWTGRNVCSDGHLQISRLVLADRPDADENLFASVPSAWVSERALLERGSALWRDLPEAFRLLFNAIFWDGARFKRYLVGPSSLAHHHHEKNGNFRHSLEVAERALAMGRGQALVHAPILALGGLIHDAGKADDYRYDPVSRRYRLSARGSLIGHRDTLQQWIAAAMAMHRVNLPEAQYLGLIHALTAAKGAPTWLGLREPRSLEATILSMADRLSGEVDLYGQLAPETAGFGRYHPQLRGRALVVGAEAGDAARAR